MSARILYRIGNDTPDYVSDDLSGAGAAKSGGRWNRKKTAMVYASESRALACLETVVHLGGPDPLPLNRYLVEISVPDAVWNARVVFDAKANIGWDAEPPGKVSLDWGTQWADSMRSAIAQVPSIIVPEEWNFLVNPAHPDASRIAASKVRKWTYDVRLK